MGCFKFAIVIAAFVGYVSAKGYNIGTRPTDNVPGQPRTGPGSGGGMRPGNGGGTRSGYGGNPGELKQSKIGGGLPSKPGNNYGPIAQTPVGVGGPIGGGLPSNRRGDYGAIAQTPVGGSMTPVGGPIGRQSNIGGRQGAVNGRQAPKPEENYPPRPFNIDYNIVDEQGNVQFRREEGDGAGVVRGTYGYRNTQGLYRTVEYEANKDGFRAVVQTNEPGTDGKENPADVVMNVEQTPAGIQEQYNPGRSDGGYQPSRNDQGRNPNNYNQGADKIGSIGGPGGPGGPNRPMPGMKPNKGSPQLPVGVNPGRNQNNYNRGADKIGNTGGPGGSRPPMPGMKPNKGSPDLPAGANPGGPQYYEQTPIQEK